MGLGPLFAACLRRANHILPAAQGAQVLLQFYPSQKYEGWWSAARRIQPDPHLRCGRALTQRARLAALHRGVLMGPDSAGLFPTNPGPRFPDRAHVADPT